MEMRAEAQDTEFLLVTGASSGLGRAMAIHLAGKHQLILSGRKPEQLEATRQECHDPHRHRVWLADLADPDTAAAALEELLTNHRIQVSGLVHSAANLQVLPLRSLSTGMVQAGMNVGVVSPMAIIKVLMKRKVNQRRLRRIVFVSSIASRFGAKGFSAYCAVKGAMDAMMRALAVELAPEVRVNSVLPGAIRTPMTEAMFQDAQVKESFERDYPLGIGEPADVTHLVAFLLSDQARWITGQEFVVDGGRTANITA